MKLTTEVVSSVFPQFTNKQLIQDIAKKASLMEFEEDEIIIDPGMPIPFVPLIISGSLRVLKQDEKTKNELLLYYLKAGETCATSLSCCMHKGESEVEVVSEEKSVLLGVPIEYLDKWTQEYPEWRDFIMMTYQKRFDELLEAINTIAFSQLDERLIKHLKELSSIQKSKYVSTSHQEIATNLNSSREVISRLLKQMEKREMVKLSRNVIELTNL
jgi:CRP/FNR family transcriptional regulator